MFPKRAVLLHFLIIPKAKQKQDEEITLPNASTKPQAADTNVFPSFQIEEDLCQCMEMKSYPMCCQKNLIRRFKSRKRHENMKG